MGQAHERHLDERASATTTARGRRVRAPGTSTDRPPTSRRRTARFSITVVLCVCAGHLALFEWLEATHHADTSLALQRQVDSEWQLFASMLQQETDALTELASYFAHEPRYVQLFAEGRREALFEAVAPAWRVLQHDFGMRQLHFHYPPATSFLRVHRPQRYGDDLSTVRHTIVHANTTREITGGFEVGRVVAGLRGVVPIYHQGRHIGCVEAGSSHEALLANFQHQVGGHCGVLLAMDQLDKTMWNPELDEFRQGSFCSEDFALDAATDEGFMSRLLTHANLDVGPAGHGTRRIAVHGVPYLLGARPLKDFSDQTVGFVIWTRDLRPTLQAQAHATRRNIVAMSLSAAAFSTLLLCLLGLGRRQLDHVIDERTRAMRTSENRYRAIAQSTPDALITCDPAGTIQLWNRAAETVFGHRSEEAIGRNLADLTALDLGALFGPLPSSDQLEALPGRIPCQHREGIARRRSGTPLFTELALSVYRDHGQPVCLLIVRDITARKHAEQQTQRLARALEAAADAVVLTDADGRILQVNPAFVSLTGYTMQEAVGQTPGLLSSGEQPREYYANLWNTIAAGQVWSGHLSNRRKDGSVYNAWLTIAPILNPHDEIIGYVGIQRDVSEDIERQQQLEQSNLMIIEALEREKRISTELEATMEELRTASDEAQSANTAKSQFLANMSHELRTPLHGILSFSSFGLRKYNKVSPEKLRSYFEKIAESGRTLLELLNDLLDLAKLEAGRMTYDFGPIDLTRIVQVTALEFTHLAEDRRLTIHTDLAEGAGTCLGDEAKLRQVIRNLLSNAVKFSPDGARVEVTVSGDAESLRLTVRDQGPGIPEGELEAVFDKFIQSSKTRSGAGGTGLGLAICREIVAAHRGRIWAENQPAGGAAFTLTLPRNHPDASVESHRTEPDRSQPASMPAADVGDGQTPDAERNPGTDQVPSLDNTETVSHLDDRKVNV